MEERRIKALFYLDECLEGLTRDEKAYCKCGAWEKDNEPMSA